MSEQATPAPANCPFFGRHTVMLWAPRQDGTHFRIHFYGQGGNECGLITDRFAPCELAVAGQPVDWRACGVIPVYTSERLRS
jgi:hypothetical protein